MSGINLKIRNFGPIKEADINVRKYNIFIGHASSGKSVVAKLLAIFKEFNDLNKNDINFETFQNLLVQYNISFEFKRNAEIEYSINNRKYVVTKGRIVRQSSPDSILAETDRETLANIANSLSLENTQRILEKLYSTDMGSDWAERFENFFLFMRDFSRPIYIPTERLLISMFSDSIFSLLNVGVNIPDCIKKFGSQYEKSRNEYKIGNKVAAIDVMNIMVSFSNDGDMILLPDNTKIKIGQASSGIQSIVPLWLVFRYFISRIHSDLLVIEEPELNLFPSTQVKLIHSIIDGMKSKNGNLVLTTHSPYVLSVIDNLILANEVRVNAKKGTKKIVESKIKELIPSMVLIDFDDVSSYFFDSNGEVIEVRDEENKLVGGECIDDASNESSRIFAELYNLKGEYGV
ncbi:AAA family ATPase [Butyricimonas faecihominis]|uniref:AAA family ATPase n=1 Tax=Butyricimonas faecihominis TaxID=1472416 RepID=UPI0026DC81D7|nr:AAA family ATPase [Butyricimonas faecihominis]